jgi:hypothetical protein
MSLHNRIYRRTKAGERALESEGSVSNWFRAILVLSAGQVTRSAICDGLRCHSQKQVLGWIDQLETLGFLDIVASTIPEDKRTPMGRSLFAATLTDARLRQGAPDQLVQ